MKKGGENFYGYKNHVKVDSKKKFVDDYSVTDASVHDSIAGVDLLTKKDRYQPLYADSAYTGAGFETAFAKVKMINKVHVKGYRNQPLSKGQKRSNKAKSRVRVRVEHVFGFLWQVTGKMIIRTIGLMRAKVNIGLMNLTYNLFRYTLYVKPSKA